MLVELSRQKNKFFQDLREEKKRHSETMAELKNEMIFLLFEELVFLSDMKSRKIFEAYKILSVARGSQLPFNKEQLIEEILDGGTRFRSEFKTRFCGTRYRVDLKDENDQLRVLRAKEKESCIYFIHVLDRLWEIKDKAVKKADAVFNPKNSVGFSTFGDEETL